MTKYVNLTRDQLVGLRAILRVVFSRRALDLVENQRFDTSQKDEDIVVRIMDYMDTYRELDLPLQMAELALARTGAGTNVSLLLTEDQIQKFLAAVRVKFDDTYIMGSAAVAVAAVAKMTKHQDDILLALKTAHEKTLQDLKYTQIGAGQA